ncbi:uncharacterized protein LOC130420646 isoform X2 [Triplophysa dalaica]|uniref:uncharacterized protein LOC130420646 isoform X2 n=1 Tax=Triplophysa dalaica TaxID=1582913 RepID=UPI0024DF8F47|nr:uncharacterized protein LOC130420646 isoform X2 [Triplophysa dalaica]
MGFFDANCSLLADKSLASRFKSSSVLKRKFNSDDRLPELETAMKIFKGPDGIPRRADSESSVAISGPSSLPDTPCRRRICDISQKSRRCRFEMLIKTRILRVQTARSLRRAANKPKAAPTSQAYFKIDVPKWSDYFSMDVPAPPIHSSDPVPDLDHPRPKRRCVDTSEKRSRRDRFEMLIQKRALRVEAIRCSRRAADKDVTASASQAYFHIIVPEWSDYFVGSPCEVFGTWPLPEEKICSIQSELHQVQTPDRSHSSDTSRQSDEERSERMEPVSTNRSTPLPLSVCVDPVSDLEDPSAKRCRVDASKENATEKIQKKIPLGRLARPTPPSLSDEMKRLKSWNNVSINGRTFASITVCGLFSSASPQSQNAKDWPKNEKPLGPGPVSFSSHTPQINTSSVYAPNVTSSDRSLAQTSFDPVRDLEDPSAKCRRLDATKEDYIEKTTKKILTRCLARPTPTSPSNKKKISSPQSLDVKDRPTNTQPVLPLAPKPASGPVTISSNGPRIKTSLVHAQNVTSSDRTLAQTSDPVRDLEDPSAMCRRLDAKKEDYIEKTTKKILIHRLAWPTSTSPSDKKKIC